MRNILYDLALLIRAKLSPEEATIEDVILRNGWVKWYGNTYRHADYPEMLEGFTLQQVMKIINNKYNEKRNLDSPLMLP